MLARSCKRTLGNSYVRHIFRPVTILLKLNDPAKHIVNVSVCSGGACMVAWGGVHGCSGGRHVWLLWGGMRGFSGACVVAPGGCMVALGGVRGCSWGACVFALGGGGMHGCSGGACMVAPGGGVWDTTRYGHTVNERAVRILLESFLFRCRKRSSKAFAKRNRSK